MSDFLVQQAIQSVWCTPTQDQQSNIKLSKITRYGGVYTKVKVMWRSYMLPAMGVLFHCYQIGGISPKYLGLTVPAAAGMWIKLSDACNNEETVADLFTINGVQSPRVLAWYTVSDDGDLVLAVQRYDKVGIDYDEEDLYLRIYHNAYYGSVRRSTTTEYIDVRGGIMRTNDDILALQTAFIAANNRGAGAAYCFVNGYFVNAIDLINIKLDDVAEFVFDGSIYAVEDFSVKDLTVFDSTLDMKRKYLVHPLQGLRDTITYQDDVDFFVYQGTGGGRFKGLYVQRTQIDAVRQITHMDYGVAVPYLDAYRNTQPTWEDLNNLTLRVHLRKSGYYRPLVNEANRIKELYKLPDAEIVAALTGVEATVPEWQAAHLEAASYTQVMRSSPKNMTPALVQDAFGYNAMSQYLGMTPSLTTNFSGIQQATIPVNLQYRATVYEYDANGLLLGWYLHAVGAVWTTRNADTRMVEIISGYATTRLDEKYGAAGATLDPALDYRMYTCGVYGGTPDEQWVDVTDGSKYVVSGNALTWLTVPETTYTLARSNMDFLGYDLDLVMQNGLLQFTLMSEQDRGNGFGSRPMKIQMGELDVFLNKQALVEDVDYVVEFPQVIIINKKYIDNNAASQKVTVRFCGHCNSDLSRTNLGDRGFVTHGVLSNNNRFNIRDDKVLHIAVGGQVIDRSKLTFAEEHSGVSVPGVANGSPYVVRDIVVPMRGTTNAKTYDLRASALVVDKHIADYLTEKLPPPTFTDASAIEGLYQVYSPFCSSLISDLRDGVLADDRMFGSYNDDVLREMCAGYEWLLKFEPTREPHKADSDFVSVEPFYKDVVTSLTLPQYRFLSRAVSLYLNNAVVLSHFINITA